MLTKLLFSLVLIVVHCSTYIQSTRFLTKPVRRNLESRSQKTREVRHEHQQARDQGAVNVAHAIRTDSPRALRRALRQFRDRPSLYLDLQLLAIETAKTGKGKDWVFDIVDTVNIASFGQQLANE